MKTNKIIEPEWINYIFMGAYVKKVSLKSLDGKRERVEEVVVPYIEIENWMYENNINLSEEICLDEIPFVQDRINAVRKNLDQFVCESKPEKENNNE